LSYEDTDITRAIFSIPVSDYPSITIGIPEKLRATERTPVQKDSFPLRSPSGFRLVELSEP